MNDRLMIAAMAMQGMYTNERYNSISFADTANEALKQADALLAAAGEKDDPATHEDCVSVAVHNAVMDRLQVDFDALRARAEAAESKLAACERERDALKRRLEPLTEGEAVEVMRPVIYGSLPPTDDQIRSIVDDADRIRARRA